MPLALEGPFCSKPWGSVRLSTALLGGYMTCGWIGVCRPVSERYPLLIIEICCHTLYCNELVENHPFLTIFRRFLDNPPTFEENLREFWAPKPTHMGGTYPYPKHVMYPQGQKLNMMKTVPKKLERNSELRNR